MIQVAAATRPLKAPPMKMWHVVCRHCYPTLGPFIGRCGTPGRGSEGAQTPPPNTCVVCLDLRSAPCRECGT